ncbi:uncharacterized protein KY384_006605 [Bacidia gigantensis]|uniref:uncharacterized protein n=1 Tax=Bacidia gigantensis TaxID=2732470 RepID=UPI001D037996|nr:uncharacterized protein KY384_006605 [Bacidia gigantensis]KAG8528916.1 hypothetical protein KY384_006605 [Bacidia gigantensis]
MAPSQGIEHIVQDYTEWFRRSGQQPEGSFWRQPLVDAEWDWTRNAGSRRRPPPYDSTALFTPEEIEDAMEDDGSEWAGFSDSVDSESGLKDEQDAVKVEERQEEVKVEVKQAGVKVEDNQEETESPVPEPAATADSSPLSTAPPSPRELSNIPQTVNYQTSTAHSSPLSTAPPSPRERSSTPQTANYQASMAHSSPLSTAPPSPRQRSTTPQTVDYQASTIHSSPVPTASPSGTSPLFTAQNNARDEIRQMTLPEPENPYLNASSIQPPNPDLPKLYPGVPIGVFDGTITQQQLNQQGSPPLQQYPLPIQGTPFWQTQVATSPFANANEYVPAPHPFASIPPNTFNHQGEPFEPNTVPARQYPFIRTLSQEDVDPRLITVFLNPPADSLLAHAGAHHNPTTGWEIDDLAGQGWQHLQTGAEPNAAEIAILRYIPVNGRRVGRIQTVNGVYNLHPEDPNFLGEASKAQYVVPALEGTWYRRLPKGR